MAALDSKGKRPELRRRVKRNILGTKSHCSRKINLEQSLPIKEKILRQALWSNDFEDDFVGLQRLAVNPAGQRWVEALSQTLSNSQFLRHNLILAIVLQDLSTQYRKIRSVKQLPYLEELLNVIKGV